MYYANKKEIIIPKKKKDNKTTVLLTLALCTTYLHYLLEKKTCYFWSMAGAGARDVRQQTGEKLVTIV